MNSHKASATWCRLAVMYVMLNKYFNVDDVIQGRVFHSTDMIAR